MNKMPSFLTPVPSSARLSDQPPPPPSWRKIVVTALLLLIFGPYCLFCGCLFIGWQAQMAIDHLNGPLRLDKTVKSLSPDHRIRFEADTDGSMRLVEVATGKMIHRQKISPKEYRKLEVNWRSNQKIRLVCHIRYQAMATACDYDWNISSGALKTSTFNSYEPQE